MQSVSIVICTYNRAAVLADTLETLAAAVPAYLGPLEILVVNNASTDSTEEVVINFMRKQPSLTINVVYEKQPGLSFARNAGLVHARGDIICFIDDDVLVPAGWLQGLLQAFKFGDRIGCVAGRITLHWPDLPIPKWLDNKYRGVLSEFNWESPCADRRSFYWR
jgi:glycosyltransferase involved in cell wall biosynthesis